jgi:hypothetical protein
VICSFGFLRRVAAIPPVFLSGRLFLFVSAQTYITLTMLAIVTNLSFRYLYGGVANVGCPCRNCVAPVIKPHNYGGFFEGLSIGKNILCTAAQTLPWFMRGRFYSSPDVFAG